MLSKRFYNNHKKVLPMSRVQLDTKRAIAKKMESGQYVFYKMPCCVCGENNFEQLSEKDGFGIYCSVVICKICGLVQQNPKMSQESYNELYEKEYRNLYEGENNIAAAYNYFFYQQGRGEDIFKYIESSTSEPFCKKRVLEIGCGAGGILKYFQDKGNEVFGIDPASDFVSYGKERGLNLEVVTLQDAKIPWQPDLVVYNNVIEHLLDPVAELKNLAKFLSKETLVYVGVPNLTSIAKNYGSDLLKFIEIAHTFYFTLPTLKNVMNMAGYSFLQGSEGMGLRAIFTLNNTNGYVENDYGKTIALLKKTEKYRLVPTPTKVIFWVKKRFVVLLKKTNLFHWFFQKIYRKTRH